MHNKSQSRIIIIGGSGLIGSNLEKTLSREKFQVVSTYNKNYLNGMIKFDIVKDNINDAIIDIKENDIIIILSAYSNPGWIAKNQEKAHELNVTATKKLIDDLKLKGCKICFMSSVEIFDGEEDYITETSIPNPLNTYGKTKFLIEKYLKENCNNFQIFRTGWNVGIDKSSRCVVTLTYETLLKPDAKMAEDNTFTVTHVEDLASNLVKFLFKKDKIVHLSSQQIISRTQLANLIIKISKNKKKMGYSTTSFSQIPYSEKRSRKNNLNSIIMNSEDISKFRSAETTIKEKIKFLDNINFS